jgi:hypothetical protein
MKKFFQSERGTVSGYVIGIVLLVVVLAGGVLLFKNASNKDYDNLVDDKADTTEVKDKTETKVEETLTNDELQPLVETPQNNTSATNPSPEFDQYPEKSSEKVPATGPEDVLPATIGVLLIAGMLYAAYNYRLSRSAIKKSLSKV